MYTIIKYQAFDTHVKCPAMDTGANCSTKGYWCPALATSAKCTDIDTSISVQLWIPVLGIHCFQVFINGYQCETG